MAKLRTLSISTGVNLGGLNSGLKRASDRLNKFSREVPGKLQSGLSSTSLIAGGVAIGSLLATGISKALSAVTGIISKAISTAVDLLKTGITGAIEKETKLLQIEVILGDAGAAQDLFKDLQNFASTTPLEMPGITDAAKMLLAFGFDVNDVIPKLTQLGDISSGVGMSLKDLAEIFGKAKVQSTLFGEDINQLTGRGIPVITALAKVMGKPEAAIKKLASEGKVTFKELELAFTEITKKGSTFGGMMERLSQTTAGLWSTLQDNISTRLTAIGERILELFDAKKLIADISSIVDAFGEFAIEILKMVDFDLAITSSVKHLKMMMEQASGLKAVFAQTFNIAVAAIKTIVKYEIALFDMFFQAAKAILYVNSQLKILQIRATEVVNQIPRIVTMISEALYNFAGDMNPFAQLSLKVVVNEMIGAFYKLSGSVDVVGYLLDGLSGVRDIAYSLIDIPLQGFTSGLAYVSVAWANLEASIKDVPFLEIFRSMDSGLANAIGSPIQTIRTMLGSLASFFNEVFTGITSAVSKSMTVVLNNFMKLNNLWNTVMNGVLNLATDITKKIAYLWQTSIDSIVKAVSRLHTAITYTLIESWSWGGENIRKETEKLQNPFKAFIGWLVEVEFNFLNIGRIAEIKFKQMGLGLVIIGQQFKYFFVDVIPVYVNYMYDSLVRITDNISTLFYNLGDNIVSIFKNLPGLISGSVKIGDLLTPLNQGLQDFLLTMPEVPERVTTDLKKALTKHVAGLEISLRDDKAAFIKNRMEKLGFGEPVKPKLWNPPEPRKRVPGPAPIDIPDPTAGVPDRKLASLAEIGSQEARDVLIRSNSLGFDGPQEQILKVNEKQLDNGIRQLEVLETIKSRFNINPSSDVTVLSIA